MIRILLTAIVENYWLSPIDIKIAENRTFKIEQEPSGCRMTGQKSGANRHLRPALVVSLTIDPPHDNDDYALQ